MSDRPSQDELEALAQELGQLLTERGWRVTAAESCTGGWIAQCLTAIAGSSDWFESGWVTYSNTAKSTLLDVDPMTLERCGAVSNETAAALAEGALRLSGADIAVSVTGIAGPAGGSVEKPVGTVWFGFAGITMKTLTERHRFDGDRRSVRAKTVALALSRLIDLTAR
ncbi:MAG: nicotinamide-nucleotide amidohydrolase family protein [Gammaproteobacteria bacterium]|nr:nicotinamide-nucleotide amidohydrolase family protein [Gammaproteobacteria bacterium]